ncbi:ATP-binding cassette sub-family C member 4 isoform X1 [Octopus bimaculoides]|uniref:ATP-binding cassette sub-family C member 4 isoform X1 n=1 Tax=Octopus bimaculoides TaxID=37653 RepID=UPI0022E18C68|nr:ATP-binding cassette sub-family C member 4 isoform X1 [Octopus bimaculoides]
MEKAKQHYNPNPMMKANFISKLFYWWLNPLLSLGYKKTLNQEDLFNVLNDDSSDILRERLTSEWEKEMLKLKHSGKPSLSWAIFRTVYKKYFLWLCVVSLDEFSKVIQPLLLGKLVSYFTPNSQMTTQQAYLYGMGVVICVLLGCLTNHIFFFNVQRLGMQIRIACCSLMFKKMLILDNASLNKTTTGQIVNLMSNDVNRFDQVLLYTHFFIIGPPQTVAIIIILWYILGPVCLLGFLVLIVIIPLQVWMGKLVSKYRCKTAIFTDQRMALMNEIIAGMRILKLYCWEIPYGKLVRDVRRLELHYIKMTKYLSSIHLCSLDAHYFLVYITVVIIYTVGNKIFPETLFIIRPLMHILSFSMLFFIFMAIRNFNEAKSSVKRIQDFLVLEELPAVPAITNECSDNQAPSIVMNNVCANWNKESNSNNMILDDISVSLNDNQLLAVVGPVGAGKSSLLMCILHELPVLSGKLTVNGTVGYVAQKPWVFSASLRQNIVFGKKYEEKRYKGILKACALEKDLSILPNGDFTLVGERGITLSGGQRARVSLARALYMDADIYILDDPLSAVDTNVGRHIFNNCINGYLKDKPRILVTHQLQFLPDADHIIILDQGKLVGEGSFDKLLESGVNFAALLNKNNKEDSENIPKSLSYIDLRETSTSMTDISNRIGSMLSLCSIGNEIEPEPVQIKAEASETGHVKFNVYYEYLKAGAHLIFGLFTFIAFILSVLFCVATDFWIAMWSNKEQLRYVALQEHNKLLDDGYNNTNVTIVTIDFKQNLYIYSALTLGIFLFSLLKAFMFYWSCIQSSVTLHNSMYDSLMRAKIAFFDENPVGRVLNRFSKDIGLIDDILPSSIVDFLQCFFLTLSVIFVTGSTNPYIFIAAFIILVLFVFVRQYYIQTSRSLKRLETVARSPVFSHISSSIEGLNTIRAFKSQQQFLTDFDDFQDIHTEAWFLFIATTRWLSVRLDLLCSLFIFAVIFASIPLSGRLDAGTVGLSVSYSFVLTGMFQWFIRQTVDVENNIVAVERVIEYSKLPTEASLDSEPSQKPPDDWPQRGAISARNLSLKYSENADFVLKHLDFMIASQEKIGIVGRTGAGKSSLINVLFRLVEPEGEITIDDIHICNIGLRDLRCKLSIIPQDPVLFKGTLKQNLDPFNEYDDHDLWKSLEDVQLKSMVDDSAEGLNFEVCEGGSNLSVGQRQLVCLARAVLRENKILIIDEATANVDLRTDALIQNTIRDKFRQCTVLTIAHRLVTIMDSDRVMVLEEGHIVQFDMPYNLLKSKEGYFYDMVQQTGPSEIEHLTAIAESAMNKKNEEISTSNSIHKRFKSDEMNGSVASITI